MPKRKDAGYYDIGRIEPKRDGPPPRRCGTFGVIRGEAIEERPETEWSHICEGIIKTSKWAAFRIGPDSTGKSTQTDLLHAFDTKEDAVEYVNRRYGDKFDKTY